MNSNFKKVVRLLLLLYSLFFVNDVYCQNKETLTFCNPLDLPYRFQIEAPSRRTNADPTVILFKDTYFMFVSKAGGYYHSDNLVDWKIQTINDLPIEDWSPAAFNLGDTIVLFISTSSNKIYSSEDPLTGRWNIQAQLPMQVADASFFLDDDGKFYIFSGLSYQSPIWGVELNIQENFQPIGEPVDLIGANYEEHGWEIRPDKLYKRAPNIEGSWINKHNGKYYLQYGAPGTQFDTYGDGVYKADHPLGPYEYEPYSPFSFKPTGFVRGTGHSSTIKDRMDNLWHFTTVVVADRHKYERRIAMFPVLFQENGNMYSHNTFGDYPLLVPQIKSDEIKDYRTGWQLLSINKYSKASSSLDQHGTSLAFDENMKTYWVAESNKEGEWLSVDLGKQFNIAAVQVNFAETDPEILGFDDSDYHQYLLEYSTDGRTWGILLDKRNNKTSVPHNYEELPETVKARYIRITNQYVPDQYFAIRDLRIFGWGEGKAPATPNFTEWYRNSFNQRYFSLKWEEVENATGYIVEYGINKDELFNHFTIFEGEQIAAPYLNKGVDYYFSIQSFNENGISEKSEVLHLPATGAWSE